MFKRFGDLFRGQAKGAQEQLSQPAPVEAPFEIITVHGRDVAAKLKELRGRAGITPVLFGDRQEFDRVLEGMSLCTQSSDQIHAAGLSLDLAQWMKNRVAEQPDYYSVEEAQTRPAVASEPLVPARDILTGVHKSEVFIGLLPVAEPWQVPMVLKFGDWNNCPGPEVHLAFFKRWSECYGAVVTAVSSDIVEFQVDRPPTSLEEARALAWEQFVYCDDIVHQGVETLGNLASLLVNSRDWYFWWD